MAVFPDKVILKHSSDLPSVIEAAVELGGSDEILPGEVVVGNRAGSVQLYARDSFDRIVGLGGVQSLGDLADVLDPSSTVYNYRNFSESFGDGDWSFNTDNTVLKFAHVDSLGLDIMADPSAPASNGTGTIYYSFDGANWDSITGNVTILATTTSVDGTLLNPPDSNAPIYLSWADPLMPALDGYVLTWNGTTGKWEPAPPEEGGTTVLVSPTPPTVNEDGEPLVDGNLWFDTTVSELHVWYNSAWVLVSGGGGGGGSTSSHLSETRTASGGETTFSNIGHSGTLQSVSSDLDAWIVVYGSAAERTADAGRGFGTDPALSSGVMAEFYVTAGSTIVATPGTSYFNNDTESQNAIYVAVRDQAGADVDAVVTIAAYGQVSPVVGSRQELSVTTSSIADGAGESVTVSDTGKAGQLLAIETDQAAWVTIYASQAARTADAARLEDASPNAGSGVIAEVITTGAQRILVTPCINFFNDEATPASELYLKVVNKSGATQAITTTLTVVLTEA